MVGAT